VPQSLIEAVAYLESWGLADAESPSGPKGIMQISAATARSMGLSVVTARRYKVTKERVQVPAKGKKKARTVTVTHKTPYTVVVRDDRMVPSRAIPAAARYIAGMKTKFGGIDWAIFAYHCGQGCVAEMQELTRRAKGVRDDDVTVPRMFFSGNPARNRELYEAVEQQMQRDFSPTYYFRVRRAEQLLAMYREDPAAFTSLAAQFRSELSEPMTSAGRAPHRLAVWIRRDDLVFQTASAIDGDSQRLVLVPDRPAYLGFSLKLGSAYARATPAAVGTLAYVAFETRRMFEAMPHSKQDFEPIPVSALVLPSTYASGGRELLSHSSGQVFDIDYSALPPAELEALRFVLADLGWSGYIGFVEEGRDNLHVGCAPASREFFMTVYREAMGEAPAE
jgi:hypothetical protein